MSGANEVLDKLFAQQKVTLSTGKEVSIKKVTLRTMKPITDLLASAIEGLRVTAEGAGVNLQDPAIILKLISKYYDQTVDAVVGLTDLDREALLDMDADDSVLIINAAIALNKDFFTKKVLPNLNLLAGGDSAN